jgi:type II secretory pathway predicted ATPase ExeA
MICRAFRKFLVGSCFIHLAATLPLPVHNPSNPVLGRDSDRLARFNLLRNPFAIRSAEQGFDSKMYYDKDTSSSKEGFVVLGVSGSGKSSLRLKIENELSNEDDRVFVVSLTDPHQMDRWFADFYASLQVTCKSVYRDR